MFTLIFIDWFFNTQKECSLVYQKTINKMYVCKTNISEKSNFQNWTYLVFGLLLTSHRYTFLGVNYNVLHELAGVFIKYRTICKSAISNMENEIFFRFNSRIVSHFTWLEQNRHYAHILFKRKHTKKHYWSLRIALLLIQMVRYIGERNYNIWARLEKKMQRVKFLPNFQLKKKKTCSHWMCWGTYVPIKIIPLRRPAFVWILSFLHDHMGHSICKLWNILQEFHQGRLSILIFGSFPEADT